MFGMDSGILGQLGRYVTGSLYGVEEAINDCMEVVETNKKEIKTDDSITV
jgi:hypothetical protein